MTDVPPSSQHTIFELPLVQEHDLASHWGKSVRTLQRWRGAGYGPAYLRFGGTVYYRVADILAFEDAQRCNAGGVA